MEKMEMDERILGGDEKLEIKKRIVESIFDAYISVFYIYVKENICLKLKDTAVEGLVLPEKGDFLEIANNYISHFVAEDYQEELTIFFNDYMNGKLANGNGNKAAMTFKATYRNWVRVIFVTLERDENGFPQRAVCAFEYPDQEVNDFVNRKEREKEQKEKNVMDVLNGLGIIFNGVHTVDISQNRYFPICDTKNGLAVMDNNRNYLKDMHIYCDYFLQEEFREEFRRLFCDIEKAQEYCRNKTKITYDAKRVKTELNGVVGTEGWIRSHFIPLDTGSEEELKAMVVFEDITQEKEKSRALSDALEAAKSASKSKSEFLSRMSHDIRTPLNGIVGLLKIIKDNMDDKDIVADGIDKIEMASKQLEFLINDVLDMSRLESGRVELRKDTFSLSALLNTLDVSLKAVARERGVELIYESMDYKHDYVIGSRTHLQRVLMNVASNAIKYNKEGGSVWCSVKELEWDSSKCWYTFTVRDNGIGMSKAFQEKMYEPFAREHAGAGTTYQGTGLGMSIIRELIMLQGGTISIQSEEALGTKVVVRIPLQVSNDEIEKENQREQDASTIKGATIIVAEDVELNMKIVCYILKKLGAEVIPVENGEEAVACFKNSIPNTVDAILMDVMMPVMNGLEAARTIRELDRIDAKTIPIIAATANAFDEDVRLCMEAGMTDHISKPIETGVLIQKLTKYLQ